MLSFLFGGNSTKTNAESETSRITFRGVLKYNSVFVTDESLDRLLERGFGARRLRPIPRACAPRVESQVKKAPHQQQQPKQQLQLQDQQLPMEIEEGERNVVENGSNFDVGTIDTPMASTPSTPFSEGGEGSEYTKVKSKGSKKREEESTFEDSGPLLLFDEEAYYLFEKEYLVLHLPDGARVTRQMLWSRFLEKNRNFPIKFKVYSYFRDLGYIVKTGIHYGLDYAVYRTLPSMCHSEICAMVVDATVPFDVSGLSDGQHGLPSKCQQGWRHISTLTRVMPDVMKLMTICYVLQNTTTNTLDASDAPKCTNADVLGEIFSGCPGSTDFAVETLDFSSPSVLDLLQVRPVTTLVRRLACRGDVYQTIRDVQTKYRSCSILKAPRQQQISKKKRRKRRDHTEVRLKAASKHNKLWKELMSTPNSVGGGGSQVAGSSGSGKGNSDGAAQGSKSFASGLSRTQEKKQLKRLKQQARQGVSVGKAGSPVLISHDQKEQNSPDPPQEHNSPALHQLPNASSVAPISAIVVETISSNKEKVIHEESESMNHGSENGSKVIPQQVTHNLSSPQTGVSSRQLRSRSSAESLGEKRKRT